MICLGCGGYYKAGTRRRHMVDAHGWDEPGSVFAFIEEDGCSNCGDPAHDDAFVAIIEGRTPEPCSYCGHVLVRIGDA